MVFFPEEILPTLNTRSIYIKIAIYLFIALQLIIITIFSEKFLVSNLFCEEKSYFLRYSELINPRLSAPIVILGSSNSAHGVQPALLKLKYPIYNFSFNGADQSFLLDFYKKYFRLHYSRPKLIIIALSYTSFEDFWRSTRQDRRWIKILDKTNFSFDYFLNYSKLSNSESIITSLYESIYWNYRGVDEPIRNREFDNGYVPYYSGAHYSEKSYKFQILDSEVISFRQLIKSIKNDGVNILIVTMPSPNGAFTASEKLKFNSIVSNISSEEKIPVLWYSDFGVDLEKDFSLFIDQVHLTPKGSYIFSTKLSRAISNLRID